jgi:hypothetical protein
MTDLSDHAALDALADVLRRHGHTVVPNGPEIEMRIALLGRIRVSVHDGVLHCTTYFGLVERSRTALLTTLIGAGVPSALLLSGGITPLALSVGLLGLMAGIYECLRFIVSEGALAQIHQRWSEVERTSVRGELPAGEQWMHEPRERVDAAATINRPGAR